MSLTNINISPEKYNDYKEYKNNRYYKYEQENLENKLYYLEKKYEIKETEYLSKIQSLNNQLLLNKETQNQLKNQLLIKDKAIEEFNSLIKEYQIQLFNYKQKIESKNKKIEELKTKIKSFKLDNNLLSDALNTNRT